LAATCLFDFPDEFRDIAAERLDQSNESGPRGALGSLPPARNLKQSLDTEVPVRDRPPDAGTHVSSCAWLTHIKVE
jgi:hypothetical protein